MAYSTRVDHSGFRASLVYPPNPRISLNLDQILFCRLATMNRRVIERKHLSPAGMSMPNMLGVSLLEVG